MIQLLFHNAFENHDWRFFLQVILTTQFALLATPNGVCDKDFQFSFTKDNVIHMLKRSVLNRFYSKTLTKRVLLFAPF